MTYRDRKQRRVRRRGGGRGALGLVVIVAAVAFGIAMVVGVGWVLAVVSDVGLGDIKKINPGATSEIFAADGTRLGFVQSDTLREPIRYSEMPEDMREATIAIEDENFEDHAGVDFEAIARAAVRNIAAGGTLQGGSTITQQLARTLYIKDPERTLRRKLVEAKLALEIEQRHPKDWILQQYLNAIPYGTVNGRTALGIGAASETFFAKKAEDLTLAESALLAGLPQAPSQYNPFQNPRAALARRNDVLSAMADNGFITAAEAQAAKSEGLGVRSTDKFTTKREGYFFDYVQQVLIDQYGVQTLRQGGLKVYTTIEPSLQEAGRAAITASLTPPTDPSSALVAIDPSDGAIRAMASSGTYGERDFNLAAQGHRQPGSAFKTMVLTAAVMDGIDPSSTYYTSRSPIELNLPGYGPWRVETYSGNSAGNVSLEKATLLSDNSVYAQLIQDVGPDRVRETAELLGVTSKLNGYPAEGLGGLEIGVSPLEMASAYATLASGGIKHKPYAIDRIEFPDGTSKEFGEREGERVMTDGEAYEVTQVLKQNVLGGTGTSAQIGCSEGTAGKTGTTDEATDVWFVGYTPQLSTAVWVGYPDDRTEIYGGGATGGGVAAPIWQDFMEVANPTCESFPTPTEPASLSAHDSANTVSEGDDSLDDTATDAESPTGTTTDTSDPEFYDQDSGGDSSDGGESDGGSPGDDSGGSGGDGGAISSEPQGFAGER